MSAAWHREAPLAPTGLTVTFSRGGLGDGLFWVEHMREFKTVLGDLEARCFNVESVAEGDVWPFSVEDGHLSLAVVLWMSGTVPVDADARTRDATAAARAYARNQGWLTA